MMLLIPKILVKARTELDEGINLICHRNKSIKLAVQSEVGWSVVSQYENSEITDDEEDSRITRRAKYTAVRQMENKRQKGAT